MLVQRHIAVHYHLEYPDFLVKEAAHLRSVVAPVRLDQAIEQLKIKFDAGLASISVSPHDSQKFLGYAQRRGLAAVQVLNEVPRDDLGVWVLGGAHVNPGPLPDFIGRGIPKLNSYRRFTGCPVEWVKAARWGTQRRVFLDLSLCAIHDWGTAFDYGVYQPCDFDSEIFQKTGAVLPLLPDRH